MLSNPTALMIQGGEEGEPPLSEPASDYIAYYPLTGTAEDVTTDYDGVEYGGLQYIDDVERGGVSNFDGIDDFVLMSTDSAFAVNTTGEISISAWVNLATIVGEDDIFSTCSNTVASYSYFFYVQDGIPQLAQYTGTTWHQAIASNAISVDTWYHIVGTIKNSGEVRLYIDGTLVANVSAGSTTANILSVIIGRRRAYFFDGNISNVRFYNRELTTTEVTDIYEYELNNRYIPVDEGLIAYYPLDRNSMDNHYNQYDGTDTSITYDGTSALFDSTSDLITMPAFQNAITDPWSITFWYKPTDFVQNRTIVKVFDNMKFWLVADVANPSNYGVWINNQAPIDTGVNFTNGSWYFVSVTCTSTSYSVKFNNTGELTGSCGTLTTNTDNTIGQTFATANMNISNYRRYDKELSSSEVTAIYNAEVEQHA